MQGGLSNGGSHSCHFFITILNMSHLMGAYWIIVISEVMVLVKFGLQNILKLCAGTVKQICVVFGTMAFLP